DVIDVLSCLSVDGNIILQPTRWSKATEDTRKQVDPLLPNKKKKRKASEEDSDEDMTLEERQALERAETILSRISGIVPADA
ncbi:hypothetical protein H072_10069, partial [Dactylellina haptotyla CBS 200.50]